MKVTALKWNRFPRPLPTSEVCFHFRRDRNNRRADAAAKSQPGNTRGMKREADGKLTTSVRHVEAAVPQWREVTEVTGQCFLVRVYCEETTHCLVAN